MYSNNTFGKRYIFSPTLPQDVCQNLLNYFTYFIRVSLIQDALNEDVLDLVIEETVNHKNFEKSETEIETYEPIP